MVRLETVSGDQKTPRCQGDRCQGDRCQGDETWRARHRSQREPEVEELYDVPTCPQLNGVY